jgi:transcriptional regulator with XRE-family HTH domain
MYKARVESISVRIAQALGARKMRPSALCRAAHIPQSSLSLYLSGSYEPKQDRVYAMAEALNVDVAWLLGYDVPMGTFASNIKEETETVSEDLTQKERQLLELFRLLTDDEQELVLKTAKLIAK